MISYTIFQIDSKGDGVKNLFLCRKDSLKLGLPFPPDLNFYREVYTDTQDNLNPEEVHRKFNFNHPADYRGRSLSVSDIIRYTLPSGKYLYLYCDEFGFVGVDPDENHKVAKEPEYYPGSDILSAAVTLYYVKNGEMRYVTVNAMDLFAGMKEGVNENGGKVELTDAEVYETMRCCYSNWDEQTVVAVCGDEIYFHDMFMKITSK